jgi:hypothetical protein
LRVAANERNKKNDTKGGPSSEKDLHLLLSVRENEKTRRNSDGLVKEIVASRSVLLKLETQMKALGCDNFEDYRIYNVNTGIGNDCIGVVFLSPHGTQESMVFDGKTGSALYKNVKIIHDKKTFSAMRKNSLPVSDAKFIAQNIALIRDRSIPQDESSKITAADRRSFTSDSDNEYVLADGYKNTGTSEELIPAGQSTDFQDNIEEDCTIEEEYVDDIPVLEEKSISITREIEPQTENESEFTRFKRETGWVSRIERQRRNPDFDEEKPTTNKEYIGEEIFQ